MARIAELVTYPVKGCAGTPLRTSELTPAGLAHDRTFMVVDGKGDFRSQRNTPAMARVRAGIADGDETLLFGTGESESIAVKVDREGPRVDVRMHGGPYVGIDQGDQAAEWLTAALGGASRLVRVPVDHHRTVAGMTPGTSGFADSTALLMTSLSSLDLLSERIAGRGADPVPMGRFRPNIVVAGWAEPHTEDRLRTLRIGTAELGYAKLCIRCVVTTVDQDRGEKAGPEPLRTLAGYRRAADGGVAFGAKFAVVRPGTLAVGDELEATTWDEPEQGLAFPRTGI